MSAAIIANPEYLSASALSLPPSEHGMKRKSPRGIPDFSSKRGKPQPGKPGEVKPAQAAPPPPPKTKPQSTSGKSGNRGG
jgi:hypothetical protein